MTMTQHTLFFHVQWGLLFSPEPVRLYVVYTRADWKAMIYKMIVTFSSSSSLQPLLLKTESLKFFFINSFTETEKALKSAKTELFIPDHLM